MSVSYNPSAGRFIDSAGKFVAQSVVDNLLEQEQSQLAVRLKALTRLLSDQKISLSDWQLRFADTLKASHLRMLSLGAGGQERLTSRHYGAAGYQLGKQYDYLSNFAQQIHQGEITIKRAIQRAGQYASSIRPTFARAVQLSREAEGFNEAKRSLDPQANHCPSCIGHSTNGRWVPIAQITPVGTNCECGQRCRCSIQYRRRVPVSLNRGTLSTTA
jgi:hypothetical protein